MPAEGPPDEFVRQVKTVVSSWTPRRGPDWADLEARAGARPVEILRLYTAAAVALAAIIAVAFFAMTTLDIGSLGAQSTVTQAQQATNP